MNKDYIVSIVEISTDEVVKLFKATSLRQADKLRKGIEINLNHEEYEVIISCLEEDIEEFLNEF